MKKVLITGITGFVGSHLAEYCLDRKVELYGFKRYHLSSMKNVLHIEDRIKWVDCDMLDPKGVMKAIGKIKPSSGMSSIASLTSRPASTPWRHRT